jgi:hypothetical protein
MIFQKLSGFAFASGCFISNGWDIALRGPGVYVRQFCCDCRGHRSAATLPKAN